MEYANRKKKQLEMITKLMRKSVKHSNYFIERKMINVLCWKESDIETIIESVPISRKCRESKNEGVIPVGDLDLAQNMSAAEACSTSLPG